MTLNTLKQNTVFFIIILIIFSIFPAHICYADLNAEQDVNKNHISESLLDKTPPEKREQEAISDKNNKPNNVNLVEEDDKDNNIPAPLPSENLKQKKQDNEEHNKDDKSTTNKNQDNKENLKHDEKKQDNEEHNKNKTSEYVDIDNINNLW